MKENTRTQSNHFIVKLKKTLHFITTLAFFLQQLVPYSSAFAMEREEDVREGGFVRSPPPVPHLTPPNLIATPPLTQSPPLQESIPNTRTSQSLTTRPP